ncbi:MAG: hypothetical protein APF76_18025 [Desulfitibacter sp. BRH_c19]|nr:MAG: hypothetical protein APF76_18025 [Desulfitibacter sp. BRH_c19]
MKKLSIIILFLVILSLGFSYLIPLPQKGNDGTFSFEAISKNDMASRPTRSSFPIYYMEIEDANTHLAAELDIFFINSWGEPLDDIQINLPANMVGVNNIEVFSLKINNKSVNFKSYTDKIIIYLPHTMMPEDTVIISLSFETHFKSNFTRFGKYDEIYLLSLWYPVIAPRIKDNWVSFQWIPHADPYFFETAIFEINLYTDKDIMSPHPYTHTGNHYRFKTLPIRDFSLVMGTLAGINRKIYNGPEISYYSRDHRIDLVTNTQDVFNFYSEKFGPYPYSSLVFVDVPMDYFKGMEFSGMIFLNEDQIIDLFTVAHEIAHQWWYSLVGNDQLNESWIDEGLANYAAYKYCQEKGLPVADIFKIYFSLAENTYRGFPIVRKLQDFPSAANYRQAVYLKGANFWIQVEEMIGEEETFNYLRKIQNQYQYEIIDTEILIQGLVEDYDLRASDLHKLLK